MALSVAVERLLPLIDSNLGRWLRPEIDETQLP